MTLLAGATQSLPVLAENTFVGKAYKVVDGDTIWVRGGGERVKVRLLCIDAPESDQEFGQKSRNRLKQLIAQERVKVEWEERDRYGRILGKVYHQGDDINYLMVKRGYAWDYVRYTCGSDYADAQRLAESKNRGLWRYQDPTPPWEFRNQ